MTRGNRLSTAVIGCGAVTQVLYLPALVELERAGLIETVALVDPSPAHTAAIGQTLTRGRHYQDLPALLADQKPDLAIIAAPPRFHADLAVACLERGIPVLCEKPMALTAAECDRMIAAADAAGCVLAVGHFRRFFASTLTVKNILDAGLLGPARSFRFLEGEAYMWPAQSAAPFQRAAGGGGVLMDIGVHTLDLLLWWLGDVAEVRYADDAMGGVEANCRVQLRMAGGAEGTVQLSRDCPLPNRYVIECTKGWIAYLCDVVDRVEWGLYDSGFDLSAEIRASSGAAAHGGGLAAPGYHACFAAQLRNVIAAIQGSEPVRVPGIAARKCIALVEQCYDRRELLAMPWLDARELARAEELAHG